MNHAEHALRHFAGADRGQDSLSDDFSRSRVRLMRLDHHGAACRQGAGRIAPRR